MPETFDYVTADAGSGGANLAGDSITQGGTTVFLPACYLVYGSAGSDPTRVDTGAGLPVAVQGTVPVSGTFWQATQPVSIASAVPVTDNSGSLTVDAPVGTPVFVRLSDGASAITTLPVSLASVPSHAVTNAGTFAVQAAQSGTWTVGVSGSVSTGGLTDAELRASAVPISASSLPLPTGAATAAKQPALGTAGTASTDVLTVQGIASMTALKVDGSAVTQPVSVASTVTVTGAGGTFPVTDSGGSLTVDDGGSSLTVDGTVSVSGSVAVTGTFWQATQPVSAASLPLPSGASTAAKQPALGTAGTASADVLTVQGITSMTPLLVDGSGVTQPVSIGSTVTVTGTGGTFPVTDSGGSLTVDDGGSSLTVDGTVGISGSVAVTGTFWQATQPVSAASLPLPSGAATAAKQPALGTAGTASSDVITVQGVAGMTAVVVDGSAVTQPVSASSLPLPTGAATAAKQPALGTAGTASSDVLTVQGIASMTALKVDGSAVTQPVSGTFWQATQPVSIASTVTVTGTGGTFPVTDSGGSLTVDDGGSSLTVDGTVAATQSGTWSVRAQDGSGNALASSTTDPGGLEQALIVRNIPSGTQTVTGAGGTFPVTDNSGSLTVDAPVGTPVFVRLSDGASAISTLPVSLASVPSHAVTNAGTFAVQAAQSGTWAVSGPVATDSPVSANPLYLAGYGSTATPSSVSADGRITPLWCTRYGALYTVVVGAGTSATPSDGVTAGSMPPTAAFGMVWNGSTWDRMPGSTSGVTCNTELPAAAALSDSTSNPTAPMVGAGAMLYDPVAATWRRRITYNRATAFASQSRVAGNYDSSVIDAAGMRFLYIYATLSVTGGGTLTIAVNDSSGSFRLATAGTAISTTTPVVYAMGAGLTVPATGLTYVGQVWSIPVPGQFKIRATNTVTSTFEVLYELVP